MTTPALDAANAGTILDPVRLIRLDFNSGVTIGWSTRPGVVTRDGVDFSPVSDAYGTLQGEEPIETSLEEIGGFTLTFAATPALVTLLRDVTQTRVRVRIWDVARNLDTGALIDTDVPEFDGWGLTPDIRFGAGGAIVQLAVTGRSSRRDDPRGPARWDSATQALMLGDSSDLGFQYNGNLPSTLPWGSAISTLSAPTPTISPFADPALPPPGFDFGVLS
jgi:hypothetical protein